MQTQMPAPRRVFFCFVFFVATKKMKLLSGNPDGFAFAFRDQNLYKKRNRLPIYCAHLPIVTRLNVVSLTSDSGQA
jgi:hypothetical protein